MTSITGWIRLEPLPRTTDLQIALEARIADPMWLLARQWQLGEFAGEDAGSPIVANLRADVAPFDRFHAGSPGDNAAANSIDHLDAAIPLEMLVERENVRTGTNRALSAEAGLHFGRLLDLHGVGDLRSTYLDHYAIAPGVDVGFDPDGGAAARLVAGRVIEGARLHIDLARHREADPGLTTLPAEPIVKTSPELLAAVRTWMAWFDEFIDEPGNAPSSWKPSRLEYGFAVSASIAANDDPDPVELVLEAPEYHGELDWYTFSGTSVPTLRSAATPVEPRTVTRTVIPAPVTYSGQPANRYWAFEDSRVSLGALSSSAGDVGRFLLADFALLYGDDWFVIPVDLPVGSVSVVRSLTITDTFGVTSNVAPAADLDEKWTMFGLSGLVTTGVERAFLLPPTLANPIVGDPIEQVALFRDEQANMVWGVERRVYSASGYVVDRYDEHQRRIGATARQTVDGAPVAAEVVYRLSSSVPDHWIPFVPIHADGEPVTSPAIQLERRSLLRVRSDGADIIEPRGAVLTPGQPLRLQEEEVPRSGAVVERTFQIARGTDGVRHLWLGRRKRNGRGEGASGLHFDYTEPTP